MKVAVGLLFLSMTPLTVLANQYGCIGGLLSQYTIIEASSVSEAEYKVDQIPNPRQLKGKVVRCSDAKDDADIFRRDLAPQTHLRPYVPADIKEEYKKSYLCYPNGGFVSDTGNQGKEMGNCREFHRSADNSTYRLFFLTGIGMDSGRGQKFIDGANLVTRVWRRDHGGWALWVEFENGRNHGVKSVSAGAQKYATAHGLTPQVTPAEEPVNAPNSPSPAPSATNPVENILKNGVNDLLKGLGR